MTVTVLCILSVVFFTSCGVSQQARVCGNNNNVTQINNQCSGHERGGYSNPRQRPPSGPILRSRCGRYEARVVSVNPIRIIPIGNCPRSEIVRMEAHVRRNPPNMSRYNRGPERHVRDYYNRTSSRNRYDNRPDYRDPRSRSRQSYRNDPRYRNDGRASHTGLFGFARGTSGVQGWLNGPAYRGPLTVW
jgi:hypothetical protein